jgi:hypothetical protein
MVENMLDVEDILTQLEWHCDDRELRPLINTVLPLLNKKMDDLVKNLEGKAPNIAQLYQEGVPIKEIVIRRNANKSLVAQAHLPFKPLLKRLAQLVSKKGKPNLELIQKIQDRNVGIRVQVKNAAISWSRSRHFKFIF